MTGVQTCALPIYSDEIFDVNVADVTLVSIVKYAVGDSVTLEYEMAENGICTVMSLEP